MTLSVALATPSYAGDFERCRLLCDSVDRYVSGLAGHYLLVEDRDLPLFSILAGPKRRVVPESALLPRWLRPLPDPTNFGRRRIWTGAGALLRGVPPLRGWHAQQLRKLAFPLQGEAEAVLFADSDMIFLRPFDAGSLIRSETLRLYAKPDGITADMTEHAGWCRVAADLLGLAAPRFPATDYIQNLVCWRVDHVRAMLALIEARSGRDWVGTIARHRGFSEYQIYGAYADGVLDPAANGHHRDAAELCKVYWGTKDSDIDSLTSFEQVLGPGQVAVGVPSFIAEPIARLRALFEAQPR